MRPEVVSKRPTLSQTERWLQAVIVHPGPTDEAIHSPKAAREIPSSRMPVLPSKTLTANERVEVYREMYWLRLREALGIDYPELRRYLGDEQFDLLCDAYVEKYPSRAYTLNRLGDHMPKFLADGGFPSLKKRRGFVTDLARLELLMTEVFDEEEAPVLDEQQVARILLEAWDRVKLRAIPALRCGEFRYPVSEYFTAAQAGKPVDASLMRRRDCQVIVCRRNQAVYRLDVNRAAYRLFQALVSGKTLGDAVASVRVKPETLQDWFKSWVANRVFQAVE